MGKSSDSVRNMSYGTFYDIGKKDVDGLAQECSYSIANALELLQSYTKASRLSF